MNAGCVSVWLWDAGIGRMGADMVVLGRHHHNRLSTLMLGSVAGAAVQRVECPLVVVPCDDAEVSMAAAEKAASAA